MVNDEINGFSHVRGVVRAISLEAYILVDHPTISQEISVLFLRSQNFELFGSLGSIGGQGNP